MHAALALVFGLLVASSRTLQSAAPQAPQATTVKVGDVVHGEVTKDSPVVHTPTLDQSYTDAPVRGVSYTLELPAATVPDVVTIELRSYFFDAYLVVRDVKRAPVAEDDDGLLRTHARVVLASGAAGTFEVAACALHGGTGSFELRVAAGAPLELDARRRKEAELEDAGRAVQIVEALRGPEHPVTAQSLNHLAVLLDDEGRYEEARPLYQRALAIREKVLGAEHSDTASSLNDLAGLLYHQGKYEEARPLYQRALAIWEKVLGPEHPATGASLNNLGLLLQAEGKYAEARPLFERALAITEKVLGPEHPDTATSLNNLAVLLRAEGKYAEARPLYQRALAIREKVLGAEHPATATSLNNLAFLFEAEGKYEEARPLYQRALAIDEKTLGHDHPGTATDLNNFAVLLQLEGKYEEARPLYQRALAIRERVLGPGHPATTTSLNNLAALLHFEGKYEEARPLYQRALEIREKVLGAEHPDSATSLNNLALLLQAEGKYAEARPLFERALAIDEKVLGAEHPDSATSLNNLAVLLQAEGKYAEARPLFERALAIREKVLGAEHADTALSLNNLALVLLDLRNPIEAHHRAREQLTSVRAHSLMQANLASDADAMRWIGGRQAALALLLDTIPVAERSSDGFYADVLATKGGAFELVHARRREVEAKREPALRAKLEQLRSVRAALSNLFSLREIKDRVQFDRDVEHLRQQRVELESELARTVDAQSDLTPATPADIRSHLQKDAVLLDFLEHGHYEPAEWKDGKVVKLGQSSERRFSVWISRGGASESICVELGPSGALETAIAVYLGTVVGVDAGQGSRGAGLVVPLSEAASATTRLRELLWDPIAAQLKTSAVTGAVKRVIVAADGALATLPFGLIQDASGHYLIERYAFTQIEDASSLVRPVASAHDASAATTASGAAVMPALLVAGAIDYDQGAELAAVVDVAHDLRGGFAAIWHALAQTGNEAEGIAEEHHRHFAAAPRLLLTQQAPTEERLKAELPKYAVLHLATHGYFFVEGMKSVTDALREEEKRGRFEADEHHLLASYWPQFLCGIVCAGANHRQPNRDNGLLTGDEVSGLDLSHCDLVVLSACETALGKRQAGEGALSLTRSFREAGARTVISSMWQVRDDSTKDLMLDFYDRLWNQHENKLDALRDAQLHMLKENREKYGDTRPVTWGAFVLTGETE